MFFSSVVVEDGGDDDGSYKDQDKNGYRNYSVDNLLCVTEHIIPVRMNAYKVKFNGLLIKPKSINAFVGFTLKT